MVLERHSFAESQHGSVLFCGLYFSGLYFSGLFRDLDHVVESGCWDDKVAPIQIISERTFFKIEWSIVAELNSSRKGYY